MCAFISNYVSRLYGVNAIRTWLKEHKGKTFLDMMTVSDVAYVISLLKNSWCVWDQDLLVKSESDMEQEKYCNRKTLEDPEDRRKYEQEYPMFSDGRGLKRTFCGVMWNDEGMQYLAETTQTWGNDRSDIQEWTLLYEAWDNYVLNNSSCENMV